MNRGGYGLGYCGLIPNRGRLALRPTQTLIKWVPGALSPGVKRPGLEADHTLPSCAEVNRWSCIFTPSFIFMTWCLIKHMAWYFFKHRNDFTFYLTCT
jgi:hypothetical protein